MPILLEICVDTFESAVAAIEGGADRIELCSALSEGGLTPTVGLLLEVKQFLAKTATERGPNKPVPVYCMIRCRRGSDFCYSDHELHLMVHDLRLLKENGADGFVFGALDESGKVHRAHCEQVVTAAQSLPLTFHRAIDCTDERELRENLHQIIELGFSTILTSGLKPTAMQGLETIVRMNAIIADLQKTTDKPLGLMPGSGISAENALIILQRTRCGAIHGSASIEKPMDNKRSTVSMGGTNVDTLPLKVCSKAKVEELRQLIDNIPA